MVKKCYTRFQYLGEKPHAPANAAPETDRISTKALLRGHTIRQRNAKNQSVAFPGNDAAIASVLPGERI